MGDPVVYVVSPPDWQPGDPLMPHPSTVADGQVVRYMVDLLDDDNWTVVRLMTCADQACQTCLVTWAGEDPTCWVCGADTTAQRPSMVADAPF